MEYLIQKVKLIDPRSKFHQKTVDVLIQDQRIIDIKRNPHFLKIKALHSPNSCISPGWIDLGTSIGEPGNEHRETLESISKSSIKGVIQQYAASLIHSLHYIQNLKLNS